MTKVNQWKQKSKQTAAMAQEQKRMDDANASGLFLRKKAEEMTAGRGEAQRKKSEEDALVEAARIKAKEESRRLRNVMKGVSKVPLHVQP